MKKLAPSVRDDIDDAVARYRERIASEADVGRATLDEIEDHLRLLVADLRAQGMPAALAVTEAAKRLGDPSELAREHARVRTPFGAKLPLWRALAVIALVLPQVLVNLGYENWNGYAEGALALALCGAMLRRSAWARATLLGVMAWNVLVVIASLALFGGAPPAWTVACQLGAFAILVPWRRADLTATGWALAMLYPIYTAGSMMLFWKVSGFDGYLPDPQLVLAATVIAGAGLVLRARWASFAAIGAVAALAPWVHFASVTTFRIHLFGIRELTLVALWSGVVAGIAIAIIGWRTARSNVGDLRAVLS